MESDLIIKYKGKSFKLDIDFFKDDYPQDAQYHYEQLSYCIECSDFATLENRINNMLLWGGISEIK